MTSIETKTKTIKVNWNAIATTAEIIEKFRRDMYIAFGTLPIEEGFEYNDRILVHYMKYDYSEDMRDFLNVNDKRPMYGIHNIEVRA